MTTLREFYQRAYAPLRLRGKSAGTRRLYANSLSNFALYLGREPTLADLDDDTLSAFSGWFIQRERSPHTANKCVGQVLAIWRYAARKGVVSVWPDVALEKTPRRDPQAWLRHELRALFEAIEQETGHIAGFRANVWWQAQHCLLWDTAERIGAVMGLRWRHVDLREGWVLVPAELRKGRKSDKTHRLHADTCRVLSPMQGPSDSLVLPWPYSPTYIYRRYDCILIRAGLPTDRKSKFHRLRKSVASWFEAAGGNSTKLLDHESRRTTLAYLDVRIVQEQHAADVLFRPDRPPPLVG